MEGEKRQWTVRGVSPDMIRLVNILASHYGMTNGDVLDRLVGVAYRDMQAGKILEAFSTKLSLLDQVPGEETDE